MKVLFCINSVRILCCSCFPPLPPGCFLHKTESSSAGTWTLNVLWKMCGIDVHMDPNIGKRLNALGNTLTSLTGEEDIDDIADLNSVNMADLSDEDEADTMSPTIHMVSYLKASLAAIQVLIHCCSTITASLSQSCHMSLMKCYVKCQQSDQNF